MATIHITVVHVTETPNLSVMVISVTRNTHSLGMYSKCDEYTGYK